MSLQVAQFVLNHMGEGDKKVQLKELIDSGNFRVSFMPYDWSINAK